MGRVERFLFLSFHEVQRRFIRTQHSLTHIHKHAVTYIIDLLSFSNQSFANQFWTPILFSFFFQHALSPIYPTPNSMFYDGTAQHDKNWKRHGTMALTKYGIVFWNYSCKGVFTRDGRRHRRPKGKKYFQITQPSKKWHSHTTVARTGDVCVHMYVWLECFWSFSVPLNMSITVYSPIICVGRVDKSIRYSTATDLTTHKTINFENNDRFSCLLDSFHFINFGCPMLRCRN